MHCDDDDDADNEDDSENQSKAAWNKKALRRREAAEIQQNDPQRSEPDVDGIYYCDRAVECQYNWEQGQWEFFI